MPDGNDTDAIIQKVEARKKEEAERLAKSAPDPKGNSVSSKFVRDCLNANELGDDYPMQRRL